MTIPAPFVGRREELSQLRLFLEETRAGRGAVALISGELGIGKSRLIEEFTGAACELQVAVGKGRWYDSREMPAYIGFSESLRGLLDQAPVGAALDRADPYLGELSRLGPEFGSSLGLGPREPRPASEGDRYRLWRAVCALLRAAGSVAPTILALDDLQWADQGSLGLLGFLAHEIRGAPVLVLGSYRDEEAPADHPLGGLLAELVREQALRTIRLDGLCRSEVAALAAAISRSDVPENFVDTLHRQTRGNPLFVGEVVRHLIGKEPVRPGGPLVRRALPAELEVPEGLQGVITRRLAGLSADCRRLLSCASAFGREFEVSLVERVTDLGRDALLQVLGEAARAAAVREVSPGRFSFAHPLLRSVIYQHMPPTERLGAHLRAATALTEHYGANAAYHAREIARHLLAAGGLAAPEEVAAYCLKGAQQARELFVFEEARGLLTGGLDGADRLQEPNADLRMQLLLELGYSETALGRPNEAVRTYREALAVAERLGDEQAATDARRWLAAALARFGRWSEVWEVTTEALRRAVEERSYAYVGLVGSHTMALIVSGAVEEAERWVDRLLALAFDDGTRAVAQHVAACWHGWGAGNPVQAAPCFRDAQQLFVNAGLDATASQVALDRAVVSYFLGDLEEAAEAERTAERLAQSTGRIPVLADLESFRSLAFVHRGRWQEADLARERCREIAAKVGGSTVYGQLAERSHGLEVLWRSGPERACELLRTASPLRNEPLQAVLAAEAGDLEGARRLTDMIRTAVPSTGRGLFWLGVALPTASVLCTLSDASAAEWAPALARYRGSLFSWLLVDLELARIAALAKRWDEAERLFDEAGQLSEERGLRPFLGHVCHQRALMLLGRRAAGDRRAALASLETAKAIFEELGLEYLGAKVSALLAAPRRGRPRSAGPAGLTEREATVIALLAQGKSNREIAAQLFIAEKTVARHLENIYAKAGVTNRGAAVAWALREGVV